MAPRKSKTKAKAKAKSRGAKLPAKRCPKPGVMVVTRAGLIGVTTGVCERRRVDVALMGAGARTFTRGELRKVPKGQQARIKKEVSGRGPTKVVRGEVLPAYVSSGYIRNTPTPEYVPTPQFRKYVDVPYVPTASAPPRRTRRTMPPNMASMYDNADFDGL
jgi:hypothetical protein